MDIRVADRTLDAVLNQFREANIRCAIEMTFFQSQSVSTYRLAYPCRLLLWPKQRIPRNQCIMHQALQ